MTDPAHHSRPSPRAFVDLAHAVTDGRALDDAARISGIDRAFAEWLMQNWAFMILLRIIPFFKLSPNRPSKGKRIATEARTRSGRQSAPILALAASPATRSDERVQRGRYRRRRGLSLSTSVTGSKQPATWRRTSRAGVPKHPDSAPGTR
ncbi:MAG: hypothetical protein R3C97_03690 [Geminicoccaceae bacterium]